MTPWTGGYFLLVFESAWRAIIPTTFQGRNCICMLYFSVPPISAFVPLPSLLSPNLPATPHMCLVPPSSFLPSSLPPSLPPSLPQSLHSAVPIFSEKDEKTGGFRQQDAHECWSALFTSLAQTLTSYQGDQVGAWQGAWHYC